MDSIHRQEFVRDLLLVFKKHNFPTPEIQSVTINYFDGSHSMFPSWLANGTRHQSMETVLDRAEDQTPPIEGRPDHSEDYRSIYFHGQSYELSATQARVVQELWQAYDRNVPALSGEYLLEKAESESGRLVDLFKGCPLWNVLIVPGAARGNYRLNLDN